ncbi:MAG: hypothetical protein K9L62_16525 [Vallitaleaceae bacterium]|nr:hypothetical protein [Vallitaleaceae bacterium]
MMILSNKQWNDIKVKLDKIDRIDRKLDKVMYDLNSLDIKYSIERIDNLTKDIESRNKKMQKFWKDYIVNGVI